MTRLRAERDGDASAIRAVHLAAFPGPAEADLVDALRGAGRLAVSLVAEDEAEAGGAVVGHVAFSPVTAADAGGPAGGVGLAPLAVAGDCRRQGMGARLVSAGLDACRAAGWGFAVVLGDPAYYGRFGFAPASRWSLVDEYGGGDAFQALELRPGALSVAAGAGGLVRYAPEFAVFG